MNVKDLSVTLYTNEIEACKLFYVEVLGGKITFDSGWYVVITFSNNMSIAIMEPEKAGAKVVVGNVTLNFMVENVDSEYSKIKGRVNILSDIANQPWGDRSFRIMDPIGNIIYIYIYIYIYASTSIG